MATEAQAKARVSDFFGVSMPQGGITAFADNDAVPEFARTGQQPFSPFDVNLMDRRFELLEKTVEAFMAASTSVDGVDDAMQVLEDAARDGELLMAQHVLGIFAVHASKIRPGTPPLPVPPLVFLAEDGVVPFDDDDDDNEGGVGIAPQGEDRLHWFREDMYLNEHHRHWHFVYDTRGVPVPGVGIQLKNRQGEVFVYMHQQMLARYDTERLAAGLDRVAALTALGDSLGDGYDPDAREPANIGYGSRPDNLTISALDQVDLEARRQAVRDYIADEGVVNKGTPAERVIPLTAANVGTALESNNAFGTETITTQQEFDWIRQTLGGSFHLHNFGHGALAALGEGNGVMNNPHTSLQDPVFWRWHRMIDDVAQEYYATLDAYDFTNDPLQVQDADIAVFSQSETAGLDLGQQDRDALRAELATTANTHLDAGDNGVAELKTGLIRETFTYDVGSARTFDRESLFCERFAMALRVTSPDSRAATVRVFLCADSMLDLEDAPVTPARQEIRDAEHRYWIEIDRQPLALAPGINTVALLGDESSIVRKLQGQAPWPTSSFSAGGWDELHAGPSGPDEDYCDCGWPLNLHLPRGTEAGMGFKLMAMVSDGAPSAGPNACGSRAFCGSGFDAYPELSEINMGFPFDRPAPNGTIAMINASPNMGMRSLMIRHVPLLATQLGLVGTG